MSYETALKAAGATVHVFQSFGSYQGDWWARVTLRDGRSGWINGGYGSCSGCDAFEAECGYDDEECDQHRWGSNADTRDGCVECVKKAADHGHKLARFGEHYLDGLLTQEEAEARAGANAEWDMDSPEMVAFVKAHAVEALR